MKLKLLVIGAGHLGSIHCKLLAKNKDIDFVGIYDTDKIHKIKVANEYGIKYFETLKIALDNSDAVIIAAPTKYHKDIAVETIKNGKHCFIEKPVCSNIEEAKELLNLAKQFVNVRIQIGHIERFNPAIYALKKYNINPLFIEAHRLSQFKSRSTDVSVVYDLMIHDIDLVLWLTKSKVKQISANGVPIITDTIDVANTRIEFENGIVANLTASRISANTMRKFRIFQKEGYFSLDLAKGKLEAFRIIDKTYNSKTDIISTQLLGDLPILADKNIIYETSDDMNINAIEEEQRIFIGSILDNNEVGCCLEDGIEALKIAEKIAEKINEI